MENVWRVCLIEDRPASGMWHCGPNAGWVEVTHLPTMISARAFDSQHHKARQAARACCEMMVEQSRLIKCQFPERLTKGKSEADHGDDDELIQKLRGLDIYGYQSQLAVQAAARIVELLEIIRAGERQNAETRQS